MKNVLLANLIWLLHVAFILWMIVTPFTSNEPMLVLHAFVCPFLMFHWIVDEDTCSLTLLEATLRGVPCEKSFFYSLVSPIYKPRDQDVRAVAWVATVGLWLVTLSKVLRRPAMIGDVFSLDPERRKRLDLGNGPIGGQKSVDVTQ